MEIIRMFESILHRIVAKLVPCMRAVAAMTHNTVKHDFKCYKYEVKIHISFGLAIPLSPLIQGYKRTPDNFCG